MKNEKLARTAYKDYEIALQKEKELQELISTKKKEVHLKAKKGEFEKINELVEMYDEISNIEEQLEKTRRDINILAKLIVKYVFG